MYAILKNSTRFYCILLCILGTQVAAHAQLHQMAYAELPIIKKKGENFSIVPAGEDGVLVLLDSEEPAKGGKSNLDATFFDSNLQKIWETSFLLPAGMRLLEQQHAPGHVYLLMEREGFKYLVIRIGLHNGQATYIEYEEVKNFYVTHFNVIDSVIFFGGNIRDNPAIIRYNYDRGTSVVCPAINQLKAELVGMEVDQEKGMMVAVLKSKHWNNEHSIYLNTYNLEGKLLYNFSLPKEKQYNFLTFRPYLNNERELLIFGTYALRTDDMAQGIYVIKAFQNQLEALRFYDFGFLKRFFNYMPDKRRNKLEERIAKKRERDKIYQLRYNLFLHDLSITDDQILLSADVYDPMRDATNSLPGLRSWNGPLLTGYDINRRLYGGGFFPYNFTHDPMIGNRSTVYGFKFISSFACGFDKSGNLLWDNSFTVPEIEQYSPQEFTNVYAQGDTVTFMMALEEQLKYRQSYVREYQDSLYTDSLAYMRASDRTEYFVNGGIADWFGPNFLITGIRHVRNRMDSDFSREVFFMQKISLQPARIEE